MKKTTDKPTTKLSQLRACMVKNDWVGALRIAVKFQCFRGGREAEVAIKRAWASHQDPEVYRQIGYDTEILFKKGVKALIENYGK